MPSRRDVLTGAAGALGGAVVSGGSVLALTESSDDSSDTKQTTRTPTPTTTAVHTTTSDPTTTHAPTTTSTPMSTTTTTTTTTSTTKSCDSEKFDCATIDKARELGLQVRESVVFIEVILGEYTISRGTGWFVDDQGHIVTNKHVIRGHEELTVYTLDGKEFTPTVKGKSSEPDVALLKINHDSPSLQIGPEDSLSTGQPLLEVGHPESVGEWVLSLGRYEGLLKYKNEPNDLKASLPNAKGSSGAPTFSLDGDVVALTFGGMNTDPRLRGETPEPVDDQVHEELDRKVISTHEPISDVMSAVEEWK